MTFYVYKDPERKQIFYVENWKIEDINSIFYCENKNCGARLIIKGANSPKVKPYFSTLKSFPHIKGCSSHIKFRNQDKTNVDENKFDKDEFINDLINLSKPLLFSFSFIYYICKSRSINQKYNNFKIMDILIDQRSNFFYTKRIYGHHLIECKIFRFDDDKQQLIFKYPLDQELKNKYIIKLDIQNLILYRKMKRLIWNLKGYPIVIAGLWDFKNGSPITELKNEYQIYIPKI